MGTKKHDVPKLSTSVLRAAAEFVFHPGAVRELLKLSKATAYCRGGSLAYLGIFMPEPPSKKPQPR